MEKIFIFYGPNREYNKYIPETYFLLDTLIEVSDFNKKSRFSTEGKLDQVVGFSMSYSGITEGGIQNFVAIINEKRNGLKELYLQNPPDCIKNELVRHYPKDILEINYYKYPKMTKKRLNHFLQLYDKTIIGQQKAKKRLAITLYELYKQKNKNKPMVLMLYGPSGVGKTETAKFIGQLLGGKICRFQLSMYQTGDFYEYLYGAEHNKGSFAKELLERESNVILLDEFDKAHPGIWSAFYQFFDDGVYKDKNYSVDMRNAIVICTSNELSPDAIRQRIGDPLFFRINDYVKFEKLSKEAKLQICKIIFEKEYHSLDKQERELISHDDFLDKYTCVADELENYRQMQNIIRNDMAGILVEKIFVK